MAQNLAQILREEVRYYAGDGSGLNLLLYPLLNDENQTYAVIAVDNPRKDKDAVLLVVFARIKDNRIIIEEDTTDKPLYEALLYRGIAREQIVMAYLEKAVE